jgi:hypothetical protein
MHKYELQSVGYITMYSGIVSGIVSRPTQAYQENKANHL